MSGHIIRIGMLSVWISILGLCLFMFQSHYPAFKTGIQEMVERVTEGMY
ncbi:hypothetical protein B4134_0515 [Bacillus safensis]|nr:hypothetical protein [Bacillus safensis]KIL25099.1 hypothetical protein B4134_0515 [Bacillus safensis]